MSTMDNNSNFKSINLLVEVDDIRDNHHYSYTPTLIHSEKLEVDDMFVWIHHLAGYNLGELRWTKNIHPVSQIENVYDNHHSYFLAVQQLAPYNPSVTQNEFEDHGNLHIDSH